jgi:hypothetical protein
MMRENGTDPFSRDVPHCPLSEQCVYFMNELEWQEEDDRPALPMVWERGEGDGLIAQLRVHAFTCIACTKALDDARRAQRAQRSDLLGLLKDEEQEVPSTSEQIMRMLDDEPQWYEETLSQMPPEVGAFSQSYASSKQVDRPDRRVLWQSITSLVVVGIFILASSGLFGSLASLHAPFVNDAAVEVEPADGWTSAVLTIAQMGHVDIHVLDPVSGKSALLASSPFLKGTSTEGVSHDGTKLLYHVYDGKKTDYYLQPSAKKLILYTFQGKGGHAIWSNGDHYIFVSTAQGVEQVSTQSGIAKLILPGLAYPDLRFYHNGYLYYVSDHVNGAGMLNRVNVSGGAAQEVTNCSRGSNFWLDPARQTIYYVCRGQKTLFAVNTDGSNVQQMRTDAGMMIGYAEDNTPLLLNEVHGKYQIVKPGGEMQQDQVLLDDVAPGASLISADNVVVAPYGHAVVTKAVYADRHEEIWYGDLTSGEKHLLFTPGKGVQVQLGGWSRMHMPAGPLARAMPTQRLTDWRDVLMASSNTAGWLGLYNIDVQDSSSMLLEANKLPDQTHIDGIAPDGLHVLYHYADRGRTGYHILTEAGRSKVFYTLANSEAGNALWMPDSRYVLIATAHGGVLMVDSATGIATSLLPQINGAQLIFYRYPYMYFRATAALPEGALYRVNVANRSVQQVTWRSPGSTFWLSPDGFTVYYAYQGSRGKVGIYAADGDSTHQRLVSRDGMPIGFTNEDDLMIIRQSGGKFQIAQIADTDDTDANSHILLDDVAPGAVALCDRVLTPTTRAICTGNIALAPEGRSLVVAASYDDGSHRLLLIDLRTGKRTQVFSIPAQVDTHIELVGWDRVDSAI